MKLLLIAISLITGIFAFSQNELSVEKIWKNYEFYGKSVNGFRGMNDGEHFTQISTIDGKNSITKHKVSDYKGSGTELVNLSSLTLNKKNANIEDYEFNADETKLLFTTQSEKIYRHSFSAVYYTYDLTSKKLEELDAAHSPQTLATYSPDGKKIAYIHSNNIYVKNLENNKVQQITFDGKQNEIINGTTDWVYEEEFAITKAFDWSFDSNYLAYLKFNEGAVKEFTLSYYKALYPEQYTFKYPKAGEDNSKVTAHIAKIVSNELSNFSPKALDLGENEYIPRISWSSTNNTLILQTLNRHQDDVNYLAIQVNGAETTVKSIYQEKAKTYVEIDDNLIFLKDGKSILRTSEKNGYNHIYKIGFDGSETQITNGNWDVIEFIGIDPANKFIYYSAAKTSAINKGIYKISIDGKKDVAISPEIGTSNADFITGMKYFVLSHSDANHPATYKLCDNTGKAITTMEDNAALFARLANYNLAQKEFTEFKLDGRTLNAWMMKPANFDVNKKYPVYIAIYGGPGHNTVTNSWGGQDFMFHQLLTQEGYIVVSVDPRGTMYRGSDFKKSTYLQLGKLETEDFIDVAKELQKMSFVDANRIGIQGWSYGGFMTSLAMTKGADVFKMGIAVAPVTNWRYYDNVYTERFMRTPQENEGGYDDNSPINHVSKLKGKYLLIHGSGDDNVHYQNTMEMVNALVAADKQFDLFIYPNKDHGIYGGNTRNHLFNMILNYTKANL